MSVSICAPLFAKYCNVEYFRRFLFSVGKIGDNNYVMSLALFGDFRRNYFSLFSLNSYETMYKIEEDFYNGPHCPPKYIQLKIIISI